MSSGTYPIKPNPVDPRLTEHVTGMDQTGAAVETAVTINDYPEYLALGYLLNQNMPLPDDEGPGDQDLADVEEESAKYRLKATVHGD